LVLGGAEIPQGAVPLVVLDFEIILEAAQVVAKFAGGSGWG
jgi:hypothetical protein